MKNRWWLLILFLLGLSVLSFWLFSNIMAYMIISIIFTAILRPITEYLTDIEFFGISIPRSLAIIISFLILITFSASFILLLIPIVSEQIETISEIPYEKLYQSISVPVFHIEVFIINNIDSTLHIGFLKNEIQKTVLEFLEGFDFGAVLNYVLGFAGTIFVYVLAISFITFFLLYEKGLLRRTILSFVPNAYFEVVVTAFSKIERLLSNYLVGLFLQVLSIFTIIFVGLSIVGTRHAITIATFAAFVNLVPYLGPALGFGFALVVIFSTAGLEYTTQEYVWIIIKNSIVFVIAQLTDNLLLQPLIFSKSVKAHPLEIFLAIFAGAAIAGGIGMIAAVPAYTVLRVSFIEFRKGYRQYHIFKH